MATMLRLCLFALIVGGTAVAVAPAAGSDGGPVAYATYTDDGATLATVMPDGSDNRVLVPGSDPAWSPNGRWLAYSYYYEEIWRVRPDGTDSERMVRVSGRSATEPTWSPNGRRLAFTVTWATGSDEDYSEETSAVYVARSDGSRMRMLRRGSNSPAWSPDGRLIAMQSGRRLATIGPNGRGFRVLRGFSRGLSSPPRFSADGRWLLFLTPTRESSEIAPTRANLVGARTGRLQRVPVQSMAGWATDVTWTPDGQIAFLHYEWTRSDGLIPLTPSRLKTIRPDGTGARTLAELKEWSVGAGLSWRQDD